MYKLFKEVKLLGRVEWVEIECNTNLYVVILCAEQSEYDHFKVEHPQFKRNLFGYKIGIDMFWRLEGGRNKPFEMR